MLLPGVPPWTNGDLVLYHGTTDNHVPSIMSGINVMRGNSRADFGRGFYTTTRYEQALEWASDRAVRMVEQPAVIEFAVSRDELARLESLSFVLGDPQSADYWSFVNCCKTTGGNHMRLYGSPWYDAVLGPVAGKWKEMKLTRKPMDQVSFHTSTGARVLNRSIKRRME